MFNFRLYKYIKNNVMKIIYSSLFLAILLIGCQPEPDNSAKEAFEKNSKIVLTFLEGFQNESLDYSALYSKDFVMLGTNFGSKDSLNLEEVMENDKAAWETYDFELLTRKPNIIMFSVGSNDSLYLKSEDDNYINFKKFEKNLNELYKKSKKFTKKIIFVGLIKVDENKTNPIPWNINMCYTNKYIKI